MEHPARHRLPLPGLLLGALGVAAVTLLFSQVVRVNASTVGFSLLLVVLGVATTSGFRVSAIVSVAAMLCFNYYFLPPVGRFTIADPENWVALLTFLITALVASHLADRARRRAEEARQRQQETEQLYSLSRAILLTDFAQPIGTQAAQSIAQIFATPAVLLLDSKSGQRFRGGTQEPGGWERLLDEVVRTGGHVRDADQDADVWAISLGGSPMGALGAVGLHASDGAVQSMLNLVAIALERVRTEEAVTRAEIARQSEEVKSILLDAIAHEFKTPLTSIKAAATGLRTLSAARAEDQQELTTVIEEEVDRLSALVSDASRMAEIDAGKVTLRPAPILASELLLAVREGFRDRGMERIEIDRSADGSVLADRDLMVLALRQVVDNALKYTDPESTVRCAIVDLPDTVEVRVEDHGPGIPVRERTRIFDKFYRMSQARDGVPGSGMGLHIAREIVRMHGGDLWVEPGDPGGSVFCFRLPSARGEA